MVTRDNIISNAVDDCLKELYSLVQPQVSWDDFVEENKEYSNKYKEWESDRYSRPEWKDKSITECIGPRPYEFYFLPKEIMKDICDSYVHAYRLDSQQNLLDIISILKDYCKKPIIDKWIERDGNEPGYRGYDHPDNLATEITKILNDKHQALHIGEAEELQDKFFEFLDMAGNFFNWNRDLNTFNCSVYLGPSPNSNKDAVIKNWKEYRNKDVKIDEEQMKKEYYGDNDE